jgi:predicted phage tail protein
MKIILEGVAGKRFGREHNIQVSTPNEAIRALCHKLTGFRAYMEGSHEFGIYWKVLTNRSKEGINYEDLDFACQELVLVPVITGANLFKGFLNIIIGLALIAFAFTGFGLITWGAAGTISAGIQTAVASLGFGLLFTGIAGLLTPGTPQKDNKQEGTQSDAAIFSGAQSTTSQGTPIPLVYGEFLCQSIPVISSYISNNTGYYMGVVSEGKIQGLPGKAEDNIFLNGARLGISHVDAIQLTDGTQTARAIDFVASAGFHLSAGATLQAVDSGPNQQVLRSFVQPDADNLQIRLSYGPSYCLYSYTGKNSANSMYLPYITLGGANFLRYSVQVIDGNGHVFYDRIFDWGAFITKAVKLQILDVNISGKDVPISIRVTRLDRGDVPDPISIKNANDVTTYQWVKGDVQFVSADVTWAEQLIYPGSALLGLKFNVSEFNQMPSIMAKIKGIHVPIISSSLGISYGYSSNPAYVLLDLLTNPRYGVGGRNYTKSSGTKSSIIQPGIRMQDVDLGSFQKAAKYCENNNIEFHAVIDNTSDAYDLIKSVASTFQAQIYYAGGKIGVVIDQPVADDSEYKLFSPSNVIQESNENGEITAPCFSYEGVAKAARRTIANVSYINPKNFYAEAKVAVHHPEAIDRYGYRPIDVRAVGCIDSKTAERVGRYILGSNIYNNETITFRVASEGILLLPGDIIIIADEYKTPGTYGGRISSATKDKVTIDRTLPSGTYTGYTLYVYGDTGVCMKKTVSSVANKVITVSSDYPSKPTPMHSWILVNESDTKAFRRYRVQEISEESNGTYQVIGIKYDPKKFEFMNDGTKDSLETIGTSLFEPKGKPKLLPSGITFGLLVDP